jgi:hypothetical protein
MTSNSCLYHAMFLALKVTAEKSGVCCDAVSE